MWFLKSALSDQSSTVNKLLSEGWEPFSVVGHLKKRDRPVFKIYFKKWDFVEGVDEPAAMVTTELEKVEPFDVDVFAERLGEVISKAMSDQLELLVNKNYGERVSLWTPETASEISTEMIRAEGHINMTQEDVERTAEEMETTERREVLGNTKVEIDEDRVPVEEGTLITGGTPEGDSFRVVDDAPVEITSSTARTSAQEETIEKLRKEHGTNITAFKPGSDGFVKVLVENWEYMIAPDGKWSKKDTGAGVSSLMV
jgi:hypothetical protein